MKTHIVVFPFELFGHPGTRQGAELLAEALGEMLEEQRREKVPSRGKAYAGQVRLAEIQLECLEDYQHWRRDAREAIAEKLGRELLVWITGNHLGALPLYDELAQDPEGTLVVHFDAHLDIYHLSGCTAELSHGNFLRHVDGRLPTVAHVGHRDLFLRKKDAAPFFPHLFSAVDVALRPEGVLAELTRLAATAKRLVIDVDCDVFDPTAFPAVAHPQPMGISFAFFLQCLHAIGIERIEALALSEFDPAHDRRDQSLAWLLWLLEHLLLRRYER